MNHSEVVSFLWAVADLIRDIFKRGKYQDVILPLTVLRRLDCVLAGTKERVLAKQAELKGKKLETLDPQLRRIAGFAFYNTSRYDFEKLLADAPHLAANLRNYIAGFAPPSDCPSRTTARRSITRPPDPLAAAATAGPRARGHVRS